MKTLLLLLAALALASISNAYAGEFYLRLSLFSNESDYKTIDNDPLISNPLATFGGRWHMMELNSPNQNLFFFAEHSSGLFSGERRSGLNQIGIEVIFR